MPRRPFSPIPPAADSPLRPSKSQRKREAHAMQDLGERLVALPPASLARLALPAALHNAVVAARAMPQHGARARQMQYIGKLMRYLEEEERQALERALG